MYHLWGNLIFTITVTLFHLSPARCSGVDSAAVLSMGAPNHDGDLENVTQGSVKCAPVEYEMKDVTPLDNNDLLLKSANITLRASEYKLKNGRIFACLPLHSTMENLPVLNCSKKFLYKKHEFHVLTNGSAVLGKTIFPAGEYELIGDEIRRCAPDKDALANKITVNDVAIYVGWLCAVISVVSLIVHLCTFALVPSLRNFLGYNLASLSVAFLLAYSWVLIGQIPQVLGLACVVSAVLQQNFFMTAFFCMNVIAFDVFRTLKMATGKLVVGSRISRRRQFLWYSMYAWGSPAIITVISIIVDNSDAVPEDFRPGFGIHDICSMTRKYAKVVFFAAPAFTLILVNAVFFVMCSWIISNNTMKANKDKTKQKVALNYVLYLRLAIMMGVTWLLGIIAIIANNDVVWLIFDLLNSLQGLFLFLFFTCTKKVLKQLPKSSNIFRLRSAKEKTLASEATMTDIN